jgi:hypothetical protein
MKHVFSSQATTHTNVTLPILNTNVMFLSLSFVFSISIMQKIIKECKQGGVTLCDHVTSQMKC